MSARRLLLLAALAAASAPHVARAQAENIPLGGRSAVMGAGIAEGHDIAMPLLNPAGVAAVSSMIFGLSGSLYGWAILDVEGFNLPSSIDPQWGRTTIHEDVFTSSQMVTVPSAVGYFRHFGPEDRASSWHGVVGAAALIPVFRSQKGAGELSVTLESSNGILQRTTALTLREMDLYVGPMGGFSWRDRLRFGASIFALYRTRYIQAAIRSKQGVLGGNAYGVIDASHKRDGTCTGLLGVAGAQARVFSRLWAGLTLWSPSVMFSGSEDFRYEGALHVTTPTAGSAAVFESDSGELSLAIDEPLKLGLGLAWVHSRRFSVAADVVIKMPRSGAETAEGSIAWEQTVTGSATRSSTKDYTRRVGVDPAVDFGVGAELWIVGKVALRAGYRQTADSRVTIPPDRYTQFTTRRSHRTVSLGIGFEALDVDTSVGFAWQMESGTMAVRDLYGKVPTVTDPGPVMVHQPLSGHTFMLLISGVISEEEAREAVKEKAKQISPALPAVLP